MRRAIVILLLFILPLAAWADGMVIPTVAYPAKVTIPDQQAAISFSNGIERLVIETRFSGSGTNFAWIVPLPAQPVIEEATAGMFPTLHYLFRPEVVHDVPMYFIGFLFIIFLLFVIWRGAHSMSDAFEILFTFLVLLFIAALLLPALAAGKRKGMAASGSNSNETVSVLDRKLVGIYETATISSQDPNALANWLRDHDYALPPKAAPVIADYVKEGWIFVAAKVSRTAPESDTNSPHPLSFTFKTDKPVYPMRLTGLAGEPLNVDLYYFGDTSARAPYFNVESSARAELHHALLRQWFGSSAVVTKLSAQLSPAQMRRDVWIQRYPALFPQENRLYSRHGALLTALNWGTGVFAVGFLLACIHALIHIDARKLLSLRVYGTGFTGLAVITLVYVALPKIDVKLVKGGGWRSYYLSKTELLAASNALDDDNSWHSLGEARNVLAQITSQDTNGVVYGTLNWDNPLVGGRFREEDSPGNYILRQTNHEIQLVLIDFNGEEDPTWTLPSIPLQH